MLTTTGGDDTLLTSWKPLEVTRKKARGRFQPQVAIKLTARWYLPNLFNWIQNTKRNKNYYIISQPYTYVYLLRYIHTPTTARGIHVPTATGGGAGRQLVKWIWRTNRLTMWIRGLCGSGRSPTTAGFRRDSVAAMQPHFHKPSLSRDGGGTM